MNAKPKILIVDDKSENLKALRKVLKDLDIELVEATSGNDALKATLNHDFALALLDIQMPEMDGYELAGILREEEKTAQLPFIFISAVYTDNLNVFKGYEKGAFSFITKPFQPEILINKVKFFIDKHQQEIALVTLNDELKKINKELEAFSYSVSHDLRAPLRAINGFARILHEEYALKIDADGISSLNAIMNNSKKMGALIDDLLAFSRLGRKEITTSVINMTALVKSVREEELTGNTNDIEFIIDALLPAKGDQTLIKQVWVNLISNAIKYSKHQPKIRIKIGSYHKENLVVYYVKDNGVGFDMQYYNKLFGVFQRLHSSEEFEGTGVGLAIVQKIIHRHNGTVWAESKPKEETCFYFSLLNINT